MTNSIALIGQFWSRDLINKKENKNLAKRRPHNGFGRPEKLTNQIAVFGSCDQYKPIRALEFLSEPADHLSTEDGNF